MTNEPRRGRRALIGPLVGFAAIALTILFLEGGASITLAVDSLFDRPDEPILQQYDPELGWSGIPSLAIEDAWGAGRDVHTDDRGFRIVPSSGSGSDVRSRAICSGNSFTYGQGVGDEDTWCHLLTRIDAIDETINLGQPGYGVDQAYLRYRRDAEGLEHAYHVFAFIGPDLWRAGRADHHGFAKPILRLEDGRLVEIGVPVPRRMPAFRRKFARFIGNLRSVEAGRRLAAKLRAPTERDLAKRVERLGPMLERLFSEVEVLGRKRGAKTLFVYLPTESEGRRDGPWRRFVGDAFERSGHALIDLTDPPRGLSEAERRVLFIPPGAPAGGHYSERGNAWAAAHIAEGLRGLSHPATADSAPDGARP